MVNFARKWGACTRLWLKVKSQYSHFPCTHDLHRSRRQWNGGFPSVLTQGSQRASFPSVPLNFTTVLYAKSRGKGEAIDV